MYERIDNDGVVCSDMTRLRTFVKTKMEKAKALLSNTDTPILTVALSVGYDDVTSFTRRFKAYFGQSPGFYKRS